MPLLRHASALAAALMLVAAPAAAEPDRAAPPQPGDDPAVEQRSSAGGVAAIDVDGDGEVTTTAPTPVESLLLETADLRDARTRPEVLAAFVAERWDVEPLRLDSETSEHGGEPGAAAPAAFAVAVPGGDLTGDGREDVLAAVEGEDGQRVLRALRGDDGGQLWQVDLDGDAVLGFPAGDLVGDGHDDLLLFHFAVTTSERSSSCDPLGCRTEGEATYTWRLGVRAGADGTLLWHQEIDGEQHVVEERERIGPAYDHRVDLEATNPLVLALGAERPGGSVELVTNRLSDLTVRIRDRGVDALPAGVNEGTFTLRASTEAALVDGATGAARATGTSEDAPVVPLLRSAGDLSGDGAEDLMWQRLAYTDEDAVCGFAVGVRECVGDEFAVTLEIERVDRDLEPVWSRAFEGAGGFVLPLGADLTGDGTDELMAVVFRADDTTQPLLAGASGETVWAHEPADWPFDLPVVLGSIGGGPGEDLALLTVDHDAGDLVIRRVAGASGELLFETRRAYLEGADLSLAYLFAMPDATGDGVADVGGGSVAYEEPERDDGWWLEAVESDAFVETGAAGDLLLERAHDGERRLWPLADLTGDGMTEVRDEIVGSPLTVERTAVRVRDDAALWTLADTPWSLPRPAGDQSGDGAEELLDSRVADDAFTVDSLRGVDLQRRWAWSQPLPR